MHLEAAIYLLCFFSSSLCTYLLARSFSRTRERLLLWSGICFVLLSLNNLLVFIDIILLPEIDLTAARSLTSLAAVCTLLYGFVWEID
jgi:hypothetical protein